MIQLIHELAAGVRSDADAVLSSGTVLIYEAGTTTLKTTYQEYEAETPHANPLTLDAAGRAIVYADGRAKLVIMNAAGTLVRTIDDVGISDADVTRAQTESIAGVGLAGAIDGTIDVNVDGITVEVNSADQIAVKEDGITARELADDLEYPGDVSTEGSLEVGTTLKVGSSGPTLTGVSATVLDFGATTQRFGSASYAKIVPSTTETKIHIQKGGTSVNRPLVVSADPSAAGLMIVQGAINAAGALATGEGFTSANTGTGQYTITWSAAFSGTPTVSLCAFETTPNLSVHAKLLGVSTTQATYETYNAAGARADMGIAFIAIGQRGA